MINFCQEVRYVGMVHLFCNDTGKGTLVGYASKIELKYGTLIQCGSRCEMRSMQILNVPPVLPSLEFGLF